MSSSRYPMTSAPATISPTGCLLKQKRVTNDCYEFPPITLLEKAPSGILSML